MKPNKSELVRNSSAEVSGFILYGIGGKRAVEAAGIGQSGTKTFAEPLQKVLEKLSCPSAPCPSQNLPCSLGQGQSDPLLQRCYCTSAPSNVHFHNSSTEGKNQQPNYKTFKMVALHFPFANSSISSVFYKKEMQKPPFN